MTDTHVRTLVLARHARAESHAASDVVRELSVEGHADAAAIGRWLAQAGQNFGAVVSSPSTRTRQTWSEIQAAGVTADNVRFDERVYAGEAALLLDVLAEIPERVRKVLVIGHAPAIPELADLLADPAGSDASTLGRLRSSFPSGCLAVLRVGEPWAELTPGSARLLELATPRA
ncbi:MAG: histidine phosphatase family protein [Actinomycetota bacterium]|nr:histidine phosphatase family protein [Actinomycetota bacterium]